MSVLGERERPGLARRSSSRGSGPADPVRVALWTSDLGFVGTSLTACHRNGSPVVGSFVQDNMMRSFPDGQQPGTGGRSKF